MNLSLLLLLLLVAMESTTKTSAPQTNFDQLWDYTNPAATEQKFRALAEELEKSGDRPILAELLTQLARTQGMQGRFDEAHATLDRAEKLIDTATMPRARVRYLLERGRAFNSSDHLDQAKPLFVKALELGQKNKLDAQAIDAAHMIAIVEPSPEEQLRWNYRGVEL